MKFCISLFLLLTLACGCGGTKRPTEDIVKTIRYDSIKKITVTPKVDTIRLPSEYLLVTVPLKDLSETPIQNQTPNGRLKSTIRKVGDQLEVNCFVDEYIKIIQTQETIIETLIRQLETLDTTQTITETESPWYMKALASLGVVLLLIIIFSLGKTFIKS
ncbi:hypothetical protein BN863_28620 [Formosa agariphila KMM 3901]|uniref:Lipoprotein n=1 Tax=Formosa agariphila (strain DSM 15362 / KCTC 12365 / LMG 23005 / KMM 3901 / M-2Alg 35-1) TaxID=1347342 RepID=T2KRD9_FORAG|nr:hypothetical protein [Formosa agariphila]CDF80574.1 hypothetical protein BN863_28620 [Formosa agariphila KMM 3901]